MSTAARRQALADDVLPRRRGDDDLAPRDRLHRARDLSGRGRLRDVVVHAEWLWPAGGGIMFGSERSDGLIDNAGRSAAYLVVDDPDAALTEPVAAGATVLREMVDQDYGGRGAARR